MGYLKCKDCGSKYKLKKGESPEDFDVCHCGGVIEYHLSVNDLKRRLVVTSSEVDEREIAKKKSFDKNVLRIILIVGALLILAVPVGIAALLIYRAYFYMP